MSLSGPIFASCTAARNSSLTLDELNTALANAQIELTPGASAH
jgi:hypothetical protein